MFDTLELHLKEVDLELFINVVVLKFAIHPDVAMEAPIPVFSNCLVQGPIGHQGPLEQLQEPVGHGHDHIVIVAIIVGGCIDLLDPWGFIGPMLLGKPHDATIGELLDPVGRLPHPILNGDCKAWAAAVAIEYVPIRALLSGESGVVVDKAGLEELELFSLGVPLPGPLFLVCSMLTFALLEGADKTARDVGDCIKVISDLNGGFGSAR